MAQISFVHLLLDESLMLNAYVKSQRPNLIVKHRFPLKVNFLSDINSIIDEVELLNIEQLSSKTENTLMILRLNLILSLLKPLKLDSFKFCNAVKFTYDQLSLMTKLGMGYSYKFLIFLQYCIMFRRKLIDFYEVVVIVFCHVTVP